MSAHALRSRVEEPMGLRGPKVVERKTLVTFRCPESMKRYLEESSEQTGRDQTEIILGALALDRALESELAPDAQALRMFAAERGLDLSNDLHQVIALAVKERIEAFRSEPATKPKKK
jgi:predicted DNA-binding protein